MCACVCVVCVLCACVHVRVRSGGRRGDKVSAQLWISRERETRVEILNDNVYDDEL